MSEATTTDLSKFGAREIHMVIELLQAWENEGLPEDFYDEGVKPMMNMNSGNVFLTNDDYQVAMINHNTGKLESFYYTPYEGREGFYDELMEEYDEMHPEDQEYMDSLAEYH